MGIVVIAMFFSSAAWVVTSVHENITLRGEVLRQQMITEQHNAKCLRLRQQGIECR
jgi:hypothetical protein